MYNKVARARMVVMLYGAITALVPTVIAMSAVWSDALVVTGALGLSTVISIGLVMNTSIRVHRPVLVPVKATHQTMCQTMQVRAYLRRGY